MLVVASAAVNSVRANEDLNSSCHPALWTEVKKLADNCMYQTQAGEKCDAIQFYQGTSSEFRIASFRLNGHEYRAELFDSQFSDGGDLNDLIVERDDGCQLERTAIPAFGDLLGALTR